jgi:hypothetical protein
MEQGWLLKGSKDIIGIKLGKNGQELVFDIPNRTIEGVFIRCRS